jgi:enoyl-CoA hydratase
VLIDHAGERGFCAGGDIRPLAESGAGDGAAARAFFFEEYRLDHLIFAYPKTVIAVIDGIVMGGGVGISWPADYRIGTERTTFAMPETGIGLFPDVGGGWQLPRLHGEVGTWLGLTGARLKAADCELLGITTDLVKSADVAKLKAEIIARPAAIEEILAELEWDPGPAPVAALRDAIDRLFARDSLEGISATLAADGSDWAAAQLETLQKKSPLSLKVALRQLRTGRGAATFGDVMAMEMRIAAHMVRTHDFAEGVRAVIVDKDNQPHWHPPKLEGVTDKLLDTVFAPLPPDQEWSPLP